MLRVCAKPPALRAGLQLAWTSRRPVGRKYVLLVRANAKSSSPASDLGQIRDEHLDTTLPAREDLLKMPKVELEELAIRHGLPKSGRKTDVVDRLIGELVTKESALAMPGFEAQDDGMPAKRRMRRSSRKATSSADPLPDAPADLAAAGAEDGQPTQRKRRASRRVSTALDEDPTQGATAAASAEAPVKQRARRTSRKSATIDPQPLGGEQDDSAPPTMPRARRSSRKSATIDPAAPAGADADAEAPTKPRARRSSRKSATIDPAAAVGADADAEAPTKPRARRSSRKSATIDPEAPAGAELQPARRSSRGRSATVAAADGVEVSMSESQLSKQTKAWLQQRVVERGIYDPSLHTTKATLVAALLDGADAPPAGAQAAAPAHQDAPQISPVAAAHPHGPSAKELASRLAQRELAEHGAAAMAASAAAAASSALTQSLALPEGMLLAEEEVGLDEAPQGLLSLGSSYEEVVHQLRGSRGLEDEPSIDDGAMVALGMAAAADDAAEAPPALGSAPGLEDIAAALAEAPADPASGDLSPAEDEAEDAALGVFDRLEFDFEERPVEAMEVPPAAGAEAALAAVSGATAAEVEAEVADADAAAALGASAPLLDGMVVVDEAPDAVLGAFDHAAGVFDRLEEAAAATTAAEAAPVVQETLVLVDEAPDAALGAFDHMAFDQVAQPAADVPAAAMADSAALADASPLLGDSDMLLVDEAPDAALGAFDHMTFDPAAEQPSAQLAAAEAGPAEAVAASAAPAEASPLLGDSDMLLVDEAPDAALGAFDHMAFEPATQQQPAAASAAPLKAEALPVPAPAAAPRVAAEAVGGARSGGEAPSQGRQLKQQQPDPATQFVAWFQQVVAMFEEWQKSLSNRN